jgi:hypothetical protein
MERTVRIQQIYGYLVCLIAVITILISAGSLINAVFDLNRPQEIVEPYGPDGSTFESYRLSKLREAAEVRDKTGNQSVIPSDSTLRRMYTTERQSRVAYAHWQSLKSIVTSALMIVIALILFIIHWRWLRTLASNTTNA